MTSTALTIQQLTPGQNLESYIKTVKSLPVLSAEEEKSLAEKLYYHKDLEAARQLILASLRFVVPIARSYQGYGLPMNDLIQEGNIGLMKAVKRFNPEENVRLMTFAVHWIKAEINEFVIKNWRIVKTATTKAQRKLFFKLRGAKNSLTWFTDKEADEVAEQLGVTRADVLEMDSRLYGKDMQVDMSQDDEETEGYFAPVLVSQMATPEESLLQESEENYQQRAMQQALAVLDERSRDIIQTRWLDDSKLGLKELAERYQVSMERIRQIEVQAMKKMKLAITSIPA
ncbi:RNA polymerase sigma factor RpoH [Thiomicrospira cyclica]|uniref:RNA polymerase sigma factor RpoH n=1 Tax=Thiomicrospira cyclica (strain DSM 14477 / JCM 11371 / ALM1) TaxID=717773 RepID=F6DAX2_THICA|nr:RNA polymerase sigma factor RpoH [Thiomicrospira cyclica]AEG32305.1 RNA polymerase, sigma 32 subunit, RpoH [Thiomicrospira cyclica ALM1]